MAGVHLQPVRVRPEDSVRPCKEQQEAIRPDRCPMKREAAGRGAPARERRRGAGEGSVFARSYRLKSPFLTCGYRWQFRKSASFAGLLTMPLHVRRAGIPAHGRGDVANSPWVCSTTEVYFRRSQVSRTNVPPTIPSAFGDNGPPTFGRSECRGETYIVTVCRGVLLFGSPNVPYDDFLCVVILSVGLAGMSPF